MKIKSALALLTASFCAFAAPAQTEAEWNVRNGFRPWTRIANAKKSVTPEGLKIEVLRNDPFLTAKPLRLDPAKYNCVEIEYKAEGTAPYEYAVLYYSADGKFSEKQSVYFKNLACDGKWRTRREFIPDLKTWNSLGTVTALRFDPLGKNKGTFTLKSLRLLKAGKLTSSGHIPNPGFEQRENDGIRGWTGTGKLSAERPHSGKYCLETPEKTVMSVQDVMVLLKPNCTYRLSVWHRNDIPDGEVYFGLRESLSKDKLVSKTHLDLHKYYVTPNQSNWKQLSMVFKTSSKTVAARVFISSDNRGTGCAWWDDIRLEEIKEELPPFTLKPYPAVVTFVDHENAIAKKEKKRIFLMPEKPEDLPLEFSFDRSAADGSLLLELTGEGKSFFRQKIEIGRKEKLEIRLPIASLENGVYRLNAVFTSPTGKKHAESKRIWRLPYTVKERKFEPVKTSSVDSDGRFLVNGKPFRYTRFSHFPRLGGRLDDKLRNADWVAYAIRDYGVALASFSSWSIPELLKADLRTSMPKEKMAEIVIGAVRRHLDNCRKAGLYSGMDIRQVFSPDRSGKILDFELVCMVVRGIKDHPALLFYGFDEPELYTKLPQEKVRELFDLVKKEDPNRIVSINLCQHWRFKDFAYSDLASYDNYPYPASGLMEIVNLNRKILEARPGRPLVSIMQAFNYLGMPVPPQDFLRAELFVNIIDGSCGVSAYAWDEFRRCMLNEPELQANMKLICHIDREIDRLTLGVKRETLKVKGSHSGFSAQKRGDIFLLVNYSDSESCKLEFPVSGKHAEDLFDPELKPTIANGICRIVLPPYGTAALKVK
ncbi:MAG: hypothetical protein E7055_05505 [Lentisphaerae bacterium]|nr:hypothetical protein [Lentisphaerota bacterium]